MLKVVILGNGIAGLTAASEIRKNNKEAKITIISDEPTLTYNRPMLTKASLKGFNPNIYMVKNREWYEKHRINALLNKRITEIDSKEKCVRLKDHSEIYYDKCIYALGAESFIPPIKGAHQEGVLSIRKLHDIASLRKKLLFAKRVTVIGGGVVGLEAAWEIKKAGLQVTILEQATELMGALLDNQSARVLKAKIEAAGIDVYTGVNIDHINENKQVILQDNKKISGDLVVLSCGIKPNVDLAIQAGIEVGRSVIVNEKMETNIKDIYACGDCAQFNGVNYGLWSQSIEQAKVAAANSCGNQVSYQGIERALLFNGFDTSLFAFGSVCDDFVVHESHQKKNTTFMVNNPLISTYGYEKFFFEADRLIGGVLIGDLRKMATLKIAIHEKWSKNKVISEVLEC